MNSKSIISHFLILSTFVVSNSAFSETFEQWKKDYAHRASQRGISKSFVLKILKDVQRDQKVVERDSNQVTLDKDRSYHQFMRKWQREDNERAVQGLKLLKEHATLLQKIEDEYQVEKEIIVSLWGVETFYGTITGDYNVVRSLATLSHDGRRRKFYETQLNATLRLIKNKHTTAKDFVGSWAGATGQCQFMPSNIPAYGQDYNKDGKIDIWSTKADVFASIANFLRQVGWRKGEKIGSFISKSSRIKHKNIASIPLKDSPMILKGPNYRAIQRWNNSSLFVAFNMVLMNSFQKELK
jgi:membrane-bound lytic murein transglycosylase B